MNTTASSNYHLVTEITFVLKAGLLSLPVISCSLLLPLRSLPLLPCMPAGVPEKVIKFIAIVTHVIDVQFCVEVIIEAEPKG